MIFFVDDVKVSKGMVKFVSNLSKESVVDIQARGLTSHPDASQSHSPFQSCLTWEALREG